MGNRRPVQASTIPTLQNASFASVTIAHHTDAPPKLCCPVAMGYAAHEGPAAVMGTDQKRIATKGPISLCKTVTGQL